MPSLTKLPEPDGLLLPDVAARWGCSEQQLIEYLRSDMLEIRAYLALGKYEIHNYDFFPGMFSMDVDANGYFRLPKEVIISAFNETAVDCDGVESTGPGSVTLFLFDEDFYRHELPRGVIVMRSHLRIMKSERDRFEKKHELILNEEKSLTKANSKNDDLRNL